MNVKWQKRVAIGAFSLAVVLAYGDGKGSHSPSTVMSLSRFAGNIFEMVVDCPTPWSSYPKAKTDLVAEPWGDIGHSTNSSGPFTTNSLGDVPGTTTIYLESTGDAAFFGIGEE